MLYYVPEGYPVYQVKCFTKIYEAGKGVVTNKASYRFNYIGQGIGGQHNHALQYEIHFVLPPAIDFPPGSYSPSLAFKMEQNTPITTD